MREMSTSEASRTFSAVLDSAERSETIVVTRAGKRVALIVPAPRANGAALREVFHRWQGNAAFDDAFVANVAAARQAVSAEMTWSCLRQPWLSTSAEYVTGVLLSTDPGRTDNRRGVHDLIIAATARAVATTDQRAHFGELPDVTVRLITA